MVPSENHNDIQAADLYITSWAFSCEIISCDNLSWAANSFDRLKSPGLDGIYPVFVQQQLEFIVPFMVQLHRSVVCLGYIPSIGEILPRVVFIPKPGRLSYQKSKAFRSICLSTFFVKNLERIFDAFIRENCLKIYPLHYM